MLPTIAQNALHQLHTVCTPQSSSTCTSVRIPGHIRAAASFWSEHAPPESFDIHEALLPPFLNDDVLRTCRPSDAFKVHSAALQSSFGLDSGIHPSPPPPSCPTVLDTYSQQSQPQLHLSSV